MTTTAVGAKPGTTDFITFRTDERWTAAELIAFNMAVDNLYKIVYSHITVRLFDEAADPLETIDRKAGSIVLSKSEDWISRCQ